MLPRRIALRCKDVLSGTGFSLWSVDEPRLKPHMLKPVLRDRAGPALSSEPNRVQGFLQVVQTFIQLNVSSPGIGHERQRNTQLGPLGEGHIELHSVGFRLLAERLEVLDLEANVVQPPSFGRHGRRVRFGNEQGYSGYVGGCELTSLCRRGAKDLG